MKYLQDNLKETLCTLLKDKFELQPEEILFSIPPQRKFGDLSTTIPFILAKKMKQKPFVLGNEIIDIIKDKLDMFAEIKLANGGFINFTFKPNYLFDYLSKNIHSRPKPKNIKQVVEHTSINPNKSAHIGHLRNASLGDSLVNALAYLGYEVETQNYLDDTGIQVADVVWGLLHYQKKNLEEIKKIDNLAEYLWHLYPEVSKLFKEDEEANKAKNEVHHKIEEKISPEYEVGAYVAEEVLRDHIRVMNILGIRYDLLVRERDIIELDFFKEAKKLMEEKGVMYASQDPEKEGCMVVKYEKENIEKIIIRSNGTITYIGKDIAYTLWKVGLFDRDFYYRKFYNYTEDNKDIYMSDFNPHPAPEGFHFGGGECVYNVIDVRQSYLQNIISQLLGPLSPEGHEKRFVHFSYEMVALTPRCVQEMGFELTEEQKKKSYVEVSGRKGIAVSADELIDKLVEKSLQEVTSRHADMEAAQALDIAKKIAVGALRFFMIKYTSNAVIAFDFKDALAFEGETGPYLQYTMVRINSILRKLPEDAAHNTSMTLDTATLDEKEYADLYEILLELSMIEITVQHAIENHELAGITTYTYNLCKKFNKFYYDYHILKEENNELKNIRLRAALLVKAKLEQLLTIIGIPVPEKM